MKRARIIAIFVFFLIAGYALLFPYAHQARAQEDTNWLEAVFGSELDAAREGEVNKGGYDLRTVRGAQTAWICDILPFGPTTTTNDDGSTTLNEDGLCYNNPAFAQALFNKSAIGNINASLASLFITPPASTYLAFRDFGETLGFIPKTTYAQSGIGIGFAGLSALLPVWKVFRNFAYTIIAGIMIIISFMVMFRKHIDPKTVVTVQNALPKVVIALILITFSYAIVGIMIDFMYLTIIIAVAMFESAGLLPLEQPLDFSVLGDGYTSYQALYSRGGLFSIFYNIFPINFNLPSTDSVLSFFQSLFDIATDPEIDFIQWTPDVLVYKMFGITDGWRALWNVAGIVSLVALRVSPRVGAFPAIVGNLPHILAFLIALALLLLIIRLFIFFLTAYIQIILSLIFAPIQLVLEALPGSTSFSDWFKNLLSNLIVFPIGSVIFMLAGMFAKLALENDRAGAPLWTPPYVPFGSASATSITALLSVAILFTIPSIAGGIRESLKSKPFVEAGPGTIMGAFSAPVNLGMQLFHMWQSHQTTEYLRKQSGLSEGGGGGKGGHG